MLSTVTRKLRTLLRLPRFVQLWLLPAWLLLGAGRLAIVLFSFRRLAPRLGVHQGTASCLPLLTPGQEARATELKQVIAVAARYAPWRADCFPQAIAARILLGVHGIPYALFFGVAREGLQGGLKAHAWVGAGRVRVSGGYSFAHFTVVGCFVAPGVVPRGSGNGH